MHVVQVFTDLVVLQALFSHHGDGVACHLGGAIGVVRKESLYRFATTSTTEWSTHAQAVTASSGHSTGPQHASVTSSTVSVCFSMFHWGVFLFCKIRYNL